MASAGKSILKTGQKFVSKRAHEKFSQGKLIRAHKVPIRFVKPHMPVEKLVLTNAMKEEMSKEFTFFKFAPPQVAPEKVLEEIDVSLESFFNKREFTLENFNLLLQVLSQKGRIDESLGVIEKMKIMGIAPNLNSYMQLITGSGRAKDPETAELVFNKAKRDLESAPAILYSALISSYTHSGNHENILRLINEKKDKGFVDSVVDYTCYMNSLVKAGKAEEAIEVYKEMCVKVDLDEYMLAMAIHACTKTNDAEYALTVWGRLKSMGFPSAAYFYNEIIMALAKRKDYAEQALDIYREMRGSMVEPDARTYNGVLTACSRLGDLPEARFALRDMKEFNVELDKTKAGLLMSVYAEACLDANEDAKDLFIKEAWEIFRLCESKGWVSPMIANSLLSVHTKAYLDKQVEGLVLPLYEQYGIQKDMHTYRHLIKMYTDLAEYKTIHSLWDALKNEGVKPDMYILNGYLKSCMKTSDTDRAVEALESFVENKYTPLYMYLKALHRMPDIPLRLWAVLQEFKTAHTDDANRDYSKRLKIDKIEKRFTK